MNLYYSKTICNSKKSFGWDVKSQKYSLKESNGIFRTTWDLTECTRIEAEVSFIFSHSDRRTIIRQDERPSYFYIILSGSAIPTYKRESDGSVETLDVLKRGCTFGVRFSVFIMKH